MTTSLFPFFLVPALTNAGLISPSAKLAFYLTNTTTLATVYDADGDPISQAANGHGVFGVTADGFGRFPNIYTDNNTIYRVRLCTVLGVQLGDDLDPYEAGLSRADGSSLVGFTAAPTGAVTRNVQVKLREVEISITDYGAAEGIDSTFAFDAAIAAAGDNALRLKVPRGMEVQANPVIARDAVTVFSEGGRGEFNEQCLHPWDLSKPALTFGDGTAPLFYCGIENLHVSGARIGTNGSAVADNCPGAVALKGGVYSFTSYNSVLFGGVQALSLVPSSTQPDTAIKFFGGTIRNDIIDSTSARCMYGKRLASGGGYITDVKFIGTKMNGPTLGYMADIDGSVFPWTFSMIGVYADIKPSHGIFLRGGSSIVSWDSALDPGALGVVAIETDQGVDDISRFVSGMLNMAGNQIKFGDASTQTVPNGVTFFQDAASLYRPHIQQFFFVMDPAFPGDIAHAIVGNYDGAKMQWQGGKPHVWDSYLQSDRVRDKNGIPILTVQQPTVAHATDAATAISQLNLLIDANRQHGLIA